MKRHISKILAIAITLIALTPKFTNASHLQGAEVTYACVSPNVYLIYYKVYRDCSGLSIPATATVNLRSPGCNTGRSVNMTMVGSPQIGNFYCPQLGPPVCTMNGNPNFESALFAATVTFSVAEQACPDWIISWKGDFRPSTANLARVADLYNEAYLNLSPGINNSSPQFNNLAVPYVNKYQPILISSGAIDPDGDSLVYSLEPSLSDVNTIIPYAIINYPAGFSIVNPSDSTQVAIFGGSSSGYYSPNFPMASFFVDWNQPAPWYALQSFILDPNHGSLAFTPSVFNANTISSQGRNKYALVVKVDEFRRINGV
ncbi:MAG TPA: hypothetical protein VK927_09270, partial [Adhaeribacter sp.]|nr:hypothetical protein [Adhaeribacter sp.]